MNKRYLQISKYRSVFIGSDNVNFRDRFIIYIITLGIGNGYRAVGFRTDIINELALVGHIRNGIAGKENGAVALSYRAEMIHFIIRVASVTVNKAHNGPMTAPNMWRLRSKDASCFIFWYICR